MLEEILTRPLDEERYLVLFLDGVQLGDTHVICGLGITDTGEKRGPVAASLLPGRKFQRNGLRQRKSLPTPRDVHKLLASQKPVFSG